MWPPRPPAAARRLVRLLRSSSIQFPMTQTSSFASKRASKEWKEAKKVGALQSYLYGSPGKKARFTASDIPSEDLWKDFWKDEQGPGDLSPEKCRLIAIRYCEVSVGEHAMKHPEKFMPALLKEYNIDYDSFYMIALPLFFSKNINDVGTHMMYDLILMEHAPSTLTMMRVAWRTALGNDYRDLQSSRVFRTCFSHFNRLLLSSQDPDVFTLKGLFVQLEGKGKGDHIALPYFDKAIKLSHTLPPSELTKTPAPGAGLDGVTDASAVVRKPRWSFEMSCHYGRGIALMRLDRKEEAIEAFRVAAVELNYAPALVTLARLLPPDTPRGLLEAYLTSAAMTGMIEPAPLLAELLASKAKDPALSQAERRMAAQLRNEWWIYVAQAGVPEAQ